jgi:hypothetical protein
MRNPAHPDPTINTFGFVNLCTAVLACWMMRAPFMVPGKMPKYWFENAFVPFGCVQDRTAG